MMKISDPIIFGHAVRAYFLPVFEKHAETLAKLGVDVSNGFGDLVAKIATLPEAELNDSRPSSPTPDFGEDEVLDDL
jgi:isocitrate dehydrogenase